LDALSASEIDALAEQLRRLTSSGHGVPHLPLKLFEALRGLASVAVVELCITDPRGAVLLTWREDDHWRGWHFPGGFMAAFESLAEACERIALRELGAGFTFAGVAGVESWPSHPYASPVSILCRGTLDREPTEGRFFAEPPSDLIVEQQTYFASLAAGQSAPADLMRRDD
jgi:ADP-ribose pyrophosphatase YjhB (NUDIX family)